MKTTRFNVASSCVFLISVFPLHSLEIASNNQALFHVSSDLVDLHGQAYLSPAEFQEKLGMAKTEFYKLPKWKQNKLKMAVQLF